jgi:YD repeat-containing protein
MLMQGQRWRGKARLVASVLTVVGVLLPNAASGSADYSYDPVGRLATVRYDNGLCVAYAYDQNGNRTSQANTTSGAVATWGTGLWGCFKWTP